MLLEIVQSYERGDSDVLKVSAPAQSGRERHELASPSVADKSASPSDLFRAYKPEHPEVKILDICWAAKHSIIENGNGGSKASSRMDQPPISHFAECSRAGSFRWN
jgi:hypothetical protein